MDMRAILKLLTTNEMNSKQWEAFRKFWIKDWTDDLVVECDMDPEVAAERAELDFESYVGQEGHTSRDERVLEKRRVAFSGKLGG
tara:strand:- start:419 stop:673 length:255 start_codon:yes stop_codon:yes gene_type:complete